jgi:hypothetical protein
MKMNFSTSQEKTLPKPVPGPDAVATLYVEMEEFRSPFVYEVTALIKPRHETYLGLKTIPIEKIRSEGRYQDFTFAFYPKKNCLAVFGERGSGTLLYVNLPPITLLGWAIGISSARETIGCRWPRHRGGGHRRRGVSAGFGDPNRAGMTMRPAQSVWWVRRERSSSSIRRRVYGHGSIGSVAGSILRWSTNPRPQVLHQPGQGRRDFVRGCGKVVVDNRLHPIVRRSATSGCSRRSHGLYGGATCSCGWFRNWSI